ncbi:MAG: hypothetical protein JSR33_06920 [Proteobacteria bacterium]|nr:hypothetical protein [Pseudomonadota bacterium]
MVSDVIQLVRGDRMNFFKEAKFNKEGSDLIVCSLLEKPFIRDTDAYFQIDYVEPAAEFKRAAVFLCFQEVDKVFMSITLNKNYQMPTLLAELKLMATQSGIKTAVINKSLINTYDFSGTSRQINQLLPVLQEKLLKNRYVPYDHSMKSLAELLPVFYNKIAENIKTVQASSCHV